MRLTASLLTKWLPALLALVVGCAPGIEQGHGGGGAGATGGHGGAAGAAGGGAKGGGGEPEVDPHGVIEALGGVVIGVDSPVDPSYYPSVHVVTRLNGAVVNDETLEHSIKFPLELPFMGLAPGDEVEVQIDTPEDLSTGFPAMIQVARTTVIGGRIKLLRMNLGWSCFPTCDPPGICAWGRCRDAFVPPDKLEEYTPDWASYTYCKPKDAGAPVLDLSVGSESFAPTKDGDVVHVHKGPQGGHHIWLAMRMRNFEQTPTITLSAHVVGPGLDFDPQEYNQTFIEDAALGICEASTRLYIFPPIDYMQLLGGQMQIKLHVEDMGGAKADAERTVNISTEVIDESF